MRVLLTIPHVFAPREGSLYSSQTEAKRSIKSRALEQATIGNLCRHGRANWIHASLGKRKPVVTRQLEAAMGIDLCIHLFTPNTATLADTLPSHSKLKRINPCLDDHLLMPLAASRHTLEQADKYDMVGYMEDDLLIEDPEFFHKIYRLVELTGGEYAFIPHRCEMIPGKGDVILSGDPDGGRPDLFWATGERLKLQWPMGNREFYRATNPHSGCYFLTSGQARRVHHYWEERQWHSEFQLAGPLEQAGSGLLLPLLKIMKTIPRDYRFLMIRHQDELWKRHSFECSEVDVHQEVF